VIYAHAGHVIVDLLTLVPLVVLALWFIVMAIRARRQGGTGAGE
jgi:hypothetical protein